MDKPSRKQFDPKDYKKADGPGKDESVKYIIPLFLRGNGRLQIEVYDDVETAKCPDIKVTCSKPREPLGSDVSITVHFEVERRDVDEFDFQYDTVTFPLRKIELAERYPDCQFITFNKNLTRASIASARAVSTSPRRVKKSTTVTVNETHADVSITDCKFFRKDVEGWVEDEDFYQGERFQGLKNTAQLVADAKSVASEALDFSTL